MTLKHRTWLLAGIAVAGVATVVIAETSGPDRGERIEARMGERMGARGGDREMGMRMARAVSERLETLFETYDSDADGTLTQAEIDAGRAAQLQAFDADGDGSLTLSEYEALWLDAMRERMVDRFQFHDDDGDGLVTVDEYSEMTARLVSRLDRTGDDLLSPEDGAARRAPRAE
ncbi:MAG: hypothetical protein AAF281_02255 [Pseudomonadota bacterium]